jgi:hypothetical protein
MVMGEAKVMAPMRAGGPIPPPSAAPAPARHAPAAVLAPSPVPMSAGSSPPRVSSRGGVFGAVARLFGGGSSEPPPGPPTSAPMQPHARHQAEPPNLDLPGSDHYDADELRWLAGRASGELDLVFLVDATGSMGPYIEQVKMHLLQLVTAVKRSPLCQSLRIGLVTYRDHPPEDHTYASRVIALTDDISTVEREIEQLAASGGGDGPESVTDGLFDLVRLAWRPRAAKAVAWFGDAPPHGVEPHGDHFPNGCPCGNHWYTQAESCREMGIAIYAVGCRPQIQAYVGAEEVFRTVARTTRGMYLPVTDAQWLVPLIAGAAASELDKQRIDAHVGALVDRFRSELAATDEPERLRWLHEQLRDDHVRPRSVRLDEAVLAPSPLKFRDLTIEDVEGSLDRLRLSGVELR